VQDAEAEEKQMVYLLVTALLCLTLSAGWPKASRYKISVYKYSVFVGSNPAYS